MGKTDWTAVLYGKGEAAWSKLRHEFGAAGSRVITQLDDDAVFRGKLAAFARMGGVTEPASLELTQYILGKNSFFFEDWATHYGVVFPPKLVKGFKFPWGKEILTSQCELPNCGKVVKDCHFGFLEPTHLPDPADKKKPKPLNVMRWHKLYPNAGSPKMYFDNPWYSGEEFATIVAKDWALIPRLVHLEVVPRSTEKRPEDQVAMLGATHELPLVQTEVAKEFLFFAKNGIYLNRTVWARCKETTTTTSPRGSLAMVGHFDGDRLDVDRWDGRPGCVVGVGAAWEFPA